MERLTNMLKVAVFFIVACFVVQGLAVDREKRNLIQFARMIKKITGRNALDYNDYGCWCGVGGGGNALDGVDRCCRAHDQCYIRIERRGCNPKWSTYRSKKYCPKEACLCDKRAAECFRRNRYNSRNKGVNRNQRC
ncbi:hypothetical protein KUTeg_005217 [Tegillarca granosa]|uniref:Phospholipase A2 n=1 Tax=Tegillarca granosa TaxID=220873 RepID=A0ABQ9FJ27_TEGGR|nr:hypothetical protein KUTeg_005217 [Tegillarca granosa]